MAGTVSTGVAEKPNIGPGAHPKLLQSAHLRDPRYSRLNSLYVMSVTGDLGVLRDGRESHLWLHRLATITALVLGVTTTAASAAYSVGSASPKICGSPLDGGRATVLYPS